MNVKHVLRFLPNIGRLREIRRRPNTLLKYASKTADRRRAIFPHHLSQAFLVNGDELVRYPRPPYLEESGGVVTCAAADVRAH
jgi:hypothetical protein